MWAETLYRTDDASLLERARELYKAVLFLHGEDPGTSAYQPFVFNPGPWFGLVENPRVRNQTDRARLALHQLAAERLLPFEGSGFATSWTLELPKSANATALSRVTDVRVTFDVQAGYAADAAVAAALPAASSRAVFVSALAIDSTRPDWQRCASPASPPKSRSRWTSLRCRPAQLSRISPCCFPASKAAPSTPS